ncbi:hypothetical protein L1049_014803 [Liquidambar formosana]|uniref:DUF4218 domain-containing protein n=1 Tax=Liquidambar formosana TaxID=63359 RepID=A0AAP0RX45_LIQFO
MTGAQLSIALKNFKNVWGKGKKRKRSRELVPMSKKKSIFFELLYWEELLMRHNLDVMHVEKNVCENIIGTLLELKSSKDDLDACKDLKEMGIREKLESLEVEVAKTLCMFERLFRPSFFTIMVHLTIHLGREVRLCGPVQYHWMYPFERYMKILKGYVRNYAQPKGCIAKCYLAEECMRFCSGYMKKEVGLDDRQSRNQDFEIDAILEGHPISKGISIISTDETLQNAHYCVLFNAAEVEPYLK